jgi:hypothetical protein
LIVIKEKKIVWPTNTRDWEPPRAGPGSGFGGLGFGVDGSGSIYGLEFGVQGLVQG